VKRELPNKTQQTNKTTNTMSTRANVIIKSQGEELWFYRHSDGYPSGTLPTLNLFLKWMKEGKIRNNLSQGSGWLILIGAMEYNSIPKFTVQTEEYAPGRTFDKVNVETGIEAPTNWNVGAYEPTTEQHGDIEYLYTVDMDAMTITYRRIICKLQTFIKLN
jgi:hypothetical protein